tara:strand:- start:47 stop:1036 length:990 start_codon:yes stop_codon:yes gene_type:complete
MIKLTDIIKESKVSYLTEAFKSKLLRKFSMNNRGSLDRDLYSYLAKQGLEASKITDDQIQKQSRLPGKGISIAVTSKKVTLYAKGNRYWESNLEIDKGTIVCVFKDGKSLWYTRSWRSKDISVGNPTSYGSEDYRTFGLNKYGWQSPKAVKGIDGIQFYTISLDEDMPYMGAQKIRKLRQDIKYGAASFRDDKYFRDENKRRYDDAIENLYDDPAKVKAKIKKAKDYTDKLIQGLIGGKPNAESKKLMNSLDRSFANDAHKAISLLSRIADAMDRLYQKVRTYQEELHYDNQYEKEHGEKKSYRSAPRYGKEIAQYVNYILTNKFGSVY